MMSMHPVISSLLDLRSRCISPLAEQLHVELVPRSTITAPPMVLMLGNHSSGKSSLINHLLGKPVQRTGVAPTDDGFTVLLHGDERNLDGQTLTSNPDLPFGELVRFGPGLVQHCYGRVLDIELLRHVRLIDSPGMIDASSSNADRPYDFMSVVRWFAERCDLILLFFDPEKPGTTSETLCALTQALHGVDHKLRIVMNKMDLFDGIRDFARTYGALCWNLSRNLPTKDIPHIYTTVIPSLARPNSHLPLEDFVSALLELEGYINELPQRRIDTVLSTTMDEARSLWIRARMLTRMRRQRRTARLQTLAVGWLAALVAGGTAYWHFRQEALLQSGAWALAAGLLTLLGWYLAGLAAQRSERLQTAKLDTVFQQEFHCELIDRDRHEDMLADWEQLRPVLQRSLQAGGLDRLGRIGGGRLRQLKRLIDEDLPRLR